MTTLRSGGDDAARRSYIGVSRGTLVAADDSTKMQEVTVRARFGELFTNVEHWHPYGFTSVPMKPDGDAQAEVLIAYLGGSPDHPIAIGIGDRRSRPKNLKPGESAHHDDQKQSVHLARSGVNATGKKLTLTAGDKPETSNHELNEQLKGLRAEISQIKDLHHALFDVVSKLRANIEKVVPILAPLNLATQVTGALNGLPTGLDAMKALAGGKLQSFFQNALKDALAGFLDPSRLLAASSLLGGNIEGQIAGLKAQVANLMAANPVVGLVDDLVDEMSALALSGNAVGVIAEKTAALQAQISALTGANPVIGQVADLRGRLDMLVKGAGPALNFLEPQKRLVQGLTRSMRFGGPG